MKYLLIILSSILLTACSHDYAEDEEYVHILKTSTACKVISKTEIHPAKSTPYYQIKHKCVYIKTTDQDIPRESDKELLELLSDGTPDGS